MPERTWVYVMNVKTITIYIKYIKQHYVIYIKIYQKYVNTRSFLISLLTDLRNPTSISFLQKFAHFLTNYRSPLTVLFNVVQEATVGELSKYMLINIFRLPFPDLNPNAKPFHLCPSPPPNHGLINIHLLGAPTCLTVWSLSLIGRGHE